MYYELGREWKGGELLNVILYTIAYILVYLKTLNKM